MSRLVLTPAILCALAGSVPAATTPTLHADETRRNTGKARPHLPDRLAPINLIDPVSGTLVDERLTPVLVSGIIDGAHVTIPVAVSSLVSAIALVNANATNGAIYIRAAQHNGMVVDGQVVSATTRSLPS